MEEKIDISKLPPHFDDKAAEQNLQAKWDKEKIFKYNPARPREETFVVDTPPPTVSGSLHVGHVFSYTHTDVIVRFKRMTGMNIYYPMGWDDNGLPTERRVQNYFNVWCDPKTPYEAGLIEKLVKEKEAEEAALAAPPASSGKGGGGKKNQKKPQQAAAPARKVISRNNFIELCNVVTHKDEQAFKNLFTRISLSVDWNELYTTINPFCRKLAQQSFIDLFNKKYIYQDASPHMWDIDFQTAVAQAEAEDREVAGAFHYIYFGVEKASNAPKFSYVAPPQPASNDSNKADNNTNTNNNNNNKTDKKDEKAEEKPKENPHVSMDDSHFVIATTRPELLAACVAVAVHPEDPRYVHLHQQAAITPVFQVPVPIITSDMVQQDKGTGILMVCTFGDQTDVIWWRQNNLPLRQVLGHDGRILRASDKGGLLFVDRKEYDPAAKKHDDGKIRVPSLSPDAANAAYAKIAGATIFTAKKTMVELLSSGDHSAIKHSSVGGASSASSTLASAAPLKVKPVQIKHAVKFFEKGERPLELIPTRQWFVKLMDQKDKIFAKNKQITWYPGFMSGRFNDWTTGINQNWCISRQRYFGVPIPVWYPLDEKGEPVYAKPIVPDIKETRLPIDPSSDAPPGLDEALRGKPNGFVGEQDVFDTWFTSSLTPQIGSHWLKDDDRHKKLFPADLRPQSHEIIRTWAFYTVVKALLHEDTVPWHGVSISGWILDPDRKKMSKSVGNVVTPAPLIDSYTADGVRYWAANALLGSDTAFDEQVLRVGKRLVTKWYNAGKLVFANDNTCTAADNDKHITNQLDLALVAALADVVTQATEEFEKFEFARALKKTERFFWESFTDTYLELTKERMREAPDSEGRKSAIATLYLASSVLLRLFAPFIPYITETVWSWRLAAFSGCSSVHAASWPKKTDFDALLARGKAGPRGTNLAANSYAAVRNSAKDALTEYKKEHKDEIPEGKALEQHKGKKVVFTVEIESLDLAVKTEEAKKILEFVNHDVSVTMKVKTGVVPNITVNDSLADPDQVNVVNLKAKINWELK